MKVKDQMNRLATFTLGVLVTAVSVGTVSYVNASSGSTIRACANKKTGEMRYLAKGKCKKREKTLTWNQRGPQGVSGPQGLQGESGSTGIAGSSQQVVVVDANGNEVGFSVNVYLANALVLVPGGKTWSMDLNTGRVLGEITLSDFYSDSNCETPLAIINASSVFSDQITYRHYESGVNYSPISIYANISDTSQPVHTWVWTDPGSPSATRTCTLASKAARETRAPDSTLLTLTPVTPPVATGPLRLTVR
jgi:hypothetical protein